MAKDGSAGTKPSYDLRALHMAGLVVLLERAGGSLMFTEAEYEAVLTRHGGKTMMVVHAEILMAPDVPRPDEVRLTLTRKPPGNGELPS
jgi:hypothetical protein